MSDNEIKVPVYQEYMNPILEALRALGGEATIADLNDKVVEIMGLTPEQLAVPHGTDTSFDNEPFYRMAWARTYLKKAGLLANPSRGVWGLTELGATTGPIDEYELANRIGRSAKKQTGESDGNAAPSSFDPVDSPESDTLLQQIGALFEELYAKGKILSKEEIESAYRQFREKFGPSVLRGVDGEALLELLHARGTRDSLVYWLEFKDDEELPGRFGSISGGSALKFGIYQAKETGHWMTGIPRKQKRLTTEEAIDIARRQRDQLIAGVAVIDRYAADPENVDFQALQREMEEEAPDLAETAWGHKYFHLLCPTLLDYYHSTPYQQFHLQKLLVAPRPGRYENAKGFIDAARLLELPINHLAETLNHRNGNPHVYWRVETDAAGEDTWDLMQEESCLALGWSKVGDLADVEYTHTSKDALRNRVAEAYPGKDQNLGRMVNQLFKVATVCAEGDLVVAVHGRDVLGVGRLSGGYSFTQTGDVAAHRRSVDWISRRPWTLPIREGAKQALTKLVNSGNIIEVERQLLLDEVTPQPAPPASPLVAPERKRLPQLSGVIGRIQQVLERKRQIILFGPPGTGKTYWAERAVNELTARSWFNVTSDQLSQEMLDTLKKRQAMETCSFHPAYGYEDFLEGFRPVARGGQLAFEPRDGIFKKLCNRASKDPDHGYFLLIDEINRGEIPRIFGELLTVLERDRRGMEVTLPLTGQSFVVPENVYVLGTMNTADRSVALLDAALRRRFGFVELMPDSSVLGTAVVEGLPLGPWLDELNLRVLKHTGRDARNLQVGHSYLMYRGKPIVEVTRFVEALRDDIIPLLQEYCYESFEALEFILGPSIVDREQQRIRTELFAPDRRGDLIQALLTSFDEITTTAAAVAADTGDETDTDALEIADEADEVGTVDKAT